MATDRNKADRLDGPYMIQDRDHMSEIGQVGGEAKGRGGRQAEQSQSDSRQHGSDQQGGERSRRRSKLL